MALWQVSVNVRAYYTVEAPNEAAAMKAAIGEAKLAVVPEDIEYAGDGVDNVLLIEGEPDD